MDIFSQVVASRMPSITVRCCAVFFFGAKELAYIKKYKFLVSLQPSFRLGKYKG
jgi:hypothetical protein